MDTPLLAYRVLAIAPLGIQPDSGEGKHIRWFRGESVDEIIAELGISTRVSVPRDMHEDGSLDLAFQSFRDFRPDKILLANEFTKRIKEARDLAHKALREGRDKNQVIAGLRQVPGLERLDFSTTTKSSPSSGKNSSSVEEILKMVAIPDEQRKGREASRDILEPIDALLGQYLGILYGSESMRRLESAWTGVKILSTTARGTENVEIGFVDCTDTPLEEILDSLLASLPLDLPSLILFDSSFDNTPRSFALLEKIAELCGMLLVPGVVEVSPKFLGLEAWDELHKRPYLPHYLQEQAYAKWQSLKKKPDAQWLCACCNRLLARLRYGAEIASREIPFSEREYLWVSPVWGMGALSIQSMAKWGWPSRITDWRNCRLEDLPVRQVSAKAAFSTEAAFGEDRVAQFAKAGIIVLSSMPNTDVAFVPFDNTVGMTSLGFQLLLCTSAQFLMWCRDHFADDLPMSEIESGIRDILTLIWHKKGYDISDKIDVRMGKMDKEGKAVVGLNLELPREVLPRGGTISLEMPW